MQGCVTKWVNMSVVDGLSLRAIAKQYNVSHTTVYRAIQNEFKECLRKAGYKPPRHGRLKRIFKVGEAALIAAYRQCNRCGKRVEFIYTDGVKESARCQRCGDISLLPSAFSLR